MGDCRRLKSLATPKPKPTLTKLAIEQVEHDPDNDGDTFVLALAPPPTPPPSGAPKATAIAAAPVSSAASPEASPEDSPGGSAGAASAAGTADGGTADSQPQPDLAVPAGKRAPRVVAASTPTADHFALPTTLAEMERAWRSLRGNLSEFAAYVRRVEPSRMEALFKSNLPTDLFSALLAVLDSHFEPHEAPCALAILQALTTAGRFSILTMCLDKADRKAVDSLNIKLIEAQGRGELPADADLEALRKAYS